MVDRRVRRTRRRLRDALLELIVEMGYGDITIQNITDRADLSRATFYLHYDDKDDLLVSTLEAMFDELLENSQETIFKGDWLNNQPPVSLVAFEHVAEYSALYKVLLGERGVTYVINRVLQYLARIAESNIRQIISDEDELGLPLGIVAYHMAGSLFTLILWWLENDMPYSPDLMARAFHRLAVPGVAESIGKPFDPETWFTDEVALNADD